MKKILLGSLLVYMLLIIAGCNGQQDKKLIVLQPFGNYPDKETRLIAIGLTKVYGVNISIAKSIPLPAATCYKPMKRYNADGLISFLADRKHGAYTVMGLTDQDIFTSKNGNPHWGIMGLGTLNADACVVSTRRIHQGATRDAELVKLAVHELGHNFGLPHCANKSCIMADAEGHNNFYRETRLCNDCRRKLIDKSLINN
ncbi:matrixin family metalloprotease [Mucilaginibacter sp. AW1-3]